LLHSFPPPSYWPAALQPCAAAFLCLRPPLRRTCIGPCSSPSCTPNRPAPPRGPSLCASARSGTASPPLSSCQSRTASLLCGRDSQACCPASLTPLRRAGGGGGGRGRGAGEALAHSGAALGASGEGAHRADCQPVPCLHYTGYPCSLLLAACLVYVLHTAHLPVAVPCRAARAARRRTSTTATARTPPTSGPPPPTAPTP
jgi:hypothetical protein